MSPSAATCPIVLRLPAGVHDLLLQRAARAGTTTAELAPLLIAAAVLPSGSKLHSLAKATVDNAVTEALDDGLIDGSGVASRPSAGGGSDAPHSELPAGDGVKGEEGCPLPSSLPSLGVSSLDLPRPASGADEALSGEPPKLSRNELRVAKGYRSIGKKAPEIARLMGLPLPAVRKALAS